MSDHALVATRKGLFELIRADGGWRVDQCSFLGEPVTMFLFEPRQRTLYAALNLGHFGVKLHRRERGSADWVEVAAPAYPPQPESAKDDIPWKLVQIWSMAAGARGELWAGTLPGGLFHSTDRGESWQLVRSLWERPERREWFGGGYDVPGIHSICVDPRDARRLLVGVSCGGVWLSEDGGASWAPRAAGMRADYMPPERAEEQAIQDPHRMVQCAAAPDVLWCQHHGGIWRSGDGANSWQRLGQGSAVLPSPASGRGGGGEGAQITSAPELVSAATLAITAVSQDQPPSPPAPLPLAGEGSKTPLSDFGFAVAVHPHDPATAWFVPAQADQRRIPPGAALAVTRTRDGGKTFETLRAGLPQHDCYDLVYRHGLAVADDGRTLLMGSTTGGLWLSEDGGDNWHAIPARLPPVYAVGFC